MLLNRTPVLMYCVINGLNDLEWEGGGKEYEQFLCVSAKLRLCCYTFCRSAYLCIISCRYIARRGVYVGPLKTD